jgi:hypothetical protein
MKLFKSILVLIVFSSLWVPVSQATELKQFGSILEMIQDKNDYSLDDGTFKVIDNGVPPVIQLSPQMFQAEAEDLIRENTRRAIFYGIYKTFLHTSIKEVVVIGVPVLFGTTTYKGKYKEKIRITRKSAEKVAKLLLNVNKIEELVREDNYDGIVLHTWSKSMKKALFGDQGPPGPNVFFETLKVTEK